MQVSWQPDEDGFIAVLGTPSMPDIYPEYLTDLNIMFCPSSRGAGRIDDFMKEPDCLWCNTNTGTVDPRWMSFYDGDEAGSYYYYPWASNENVGTQLTWFAGWFFLEPDEEFGELGPTVAGLDVDMPITDDVIDEIENYSGPEYQVAWDKAFPGSPFPTTAVGNGGGDTIYRLREGIERFLITDINNPAGSAMAQSELAIMHDVIIVDSIAFESGGDVLFNHVPGGGNVLYLDGHVAWNKYPQKAPPINPVSAAAYF